MKAYKLTQNQKDSLLNKKYSTISYFNPVPDINGDWFIFEIEVTESPKPEYNWLLDLEKVDFIPPIVDL